MGNKLKKGTHLLAVLICLAMILSTFAGVGSMLKTNEAYAAAGEAINTNVTLGNSGSEEPKTINVGANAMKICSSGWNKTDGQYLYYGAYNNTPVKYRVLDRHNGTSHTKFNDNTATMTTAEGDYLLLDSDVPLPEDQFDSTEPYSNDYSGSDIADYLKEGKEVNGSSLFSSKELAQIADTTLVASTETYMAGAGEEAVVYKDYATSGKSFLLSCAEATQLYNDYNARFKGDPPGFTWWLRSADTDNYNTQSSEYIYAGFVDFDGHLCSQTVIILRTISPASNLNLGSVLFTSASGASKTSSLAKITTSTDNTWKTTLKDTTKTIKTTGTVTRSGQMVSVPYTYTGSDVDQVSLVITDGDITSSDSSVLYYGKLDGATSSSGTGTFTMPNGLPSGYKAYILAEDVNDWKCTDYASEPVEISIDDITTVLLNTKAYSKSKSMKLSWTEVNGAKCGKSMKKLKTVTSGKCTYEFKKLKRGEMYKYRVYAYDSNAKLYKSLTVHTTVGSCHGKYNASKVSATKKLSLTNGKSGKIKTSITSSHGKSKVIYKRHCSKARFVSENMKIATVSKKGIVKGIKAGTTNIYVIAPNGCRATVSVTVK